MSNIEALYNLTSVPTDIRTCLAQKNWFLIGFMPFDIIAICLNLALLAASMVNKEKLQRQNYTLASVNSALLSHTIYLGLKIWDTSESIMAMDSNYVIGVPKVMWTVCEAGLMAIEFGVVANASSVIYVTLDSTIVASRSQLNTAASLECQKSRLPLKRKIAVMLIVLSWIVPVVFIIVATLTWNCAKDCWCPMGAFKGEVCPHEHRCSRLVPPLPTLFLLINAGLWCIEIIALIAMIIKKAFEFKNSMKFNNEKGLPDKDDNASRGTTSPECDIEQHTGKYSSERSVKKSTSKIRVKFNSRFRMAIILTACLVVCFVPYVITIVIDAVKPDADLKPASMISMICLYLYMFSFPLIIMKYLPNLKDSLGLLVRQIFNPC